jgi:hypothetical protein
LRAMLRRQVAKITSTLLIAFFTLGSGIVLDYDGQGVRHFHKLIKNNSIFFTASFLNSSICGVFGGIPTDFINLA